MKQSKIFTIPLTISLSMVSFTTHTEIFFITGNPGKFSEVSEIMKPMKVLQLDIDLEEIQSTGGKAVIEAKVKEAFRDIDQKIKERPTKPFKNPTAKENFMRVSEIAKTAFRNNTAQVIIEDTSLYFNALANAKARKAGSDDMPNGLPGPLIKWFDETVGNKGLYTIAQAFGSFDAKAVTWIGYSRDGEHIQYFKGEVPGTIVSPEGSSGFGWDPIFKPEGYEKTFAGMSSEEKNKVSMRSMAAQQLKDVLSKESNQTSRVKLLAKQFETMSTEAN